MSTRKEIAVACGALFMATKALGQPILAGLERQWTLSGDSISFDINSIVVAPDGRVGVVGSDLRIRFFGLRGELLRTAGGDGAGPGEFRFIGAQGANSDAWWFLDGNLKRITIFDHDGRIKETRVDHQPMDPRVRYFMTSPVGVTRDGVVTRSALTAGGGNDLVVIDRSDTSRVRVFAHLPPEAPRVPVNVGTLSSSIRIPFAHNPLWDVSTDGTHIGILTDSLVSPSKGFFSLTLIDVAKDTVLSIRRGFEPVVISQAAADSALRVVASTAAGPPAMAKAKLAVIRSGEVQRRIPAARRPFEEMIIGQDTTIWLHREEAGPGKVWVVYSRGGVPLGFVRVPTSFRLREATRRALWGLQRDADGVNSVVRYAVRSLQPMSQLSPGTAK